MSVPVLESLNDAVVFVDPTSENPGATFFVVVSNVFFASERLVTPSD